MVQCGAVFHRDGVIVPRGMYRVIVERKRRLRFVLRSLPPAGTIRLQTLIQFATPFFVQVRADR